VLRRSCTAPPRVRATNFESPDPPLRHPDPATTCCCSFSSGCPHPSCLRSGRAVPVHCAIRPLLAFLPRSGCLHRLVRPHYYCPWFGHRILPRLCSVRGRVKLNQRAHLYSVRSSNRALVYPFQKKEWALPPWPLPASTTRPSPRSSFARCPPVCCSACRVFPHRRPVHYSCRCQRTVAPTPHVLRSSSYGWSAACRLPECLLCLDPLDLCSLAPRHTLPPTRVCLYSALRRSSPVLSPWVFYSGPCLHYLLSSPPGYLCPWRFSLQTYQVPYSSSALFTSFQAQCS
jgi:hypothetical protein